MEGYELEWEEDFTPKQVKLLKDCEHIHCKALFDAVNESMIQFRQYGKDGAPMPWSLKSRKLQKQPLSDEVDTKKMFEIVKHDVFRWSIMQSGTLPRSEFIFGDEFDEELFSEIREKKLATLLATEVIENEQNWLQYEFEEAQVRIDLGDMIVEALVQETADLLTNLEKKKSSPN